MRTSSSRLFIFVGLALLLFIFAACAPAPTPAPPPATSAPIPTTAPVATTAPTTAPTTAATKAPTTAPTTASSSSAASSSSSAASSSSSAASSSASSSSSAASSAGSSAGGLLSFSAPNCTYTDANNNPAEFKSIAATDPNTVVFTLCAPDPDFLQKVAFGAFGIEPQAYLNKTAGDTTKVADKPIGTGPYVLSEWVRGDHMTFTANPNYWGPAPANKTVVLKWSKEASQRLVELQSGQADGIDNVAPEDMATVQKDSNLKLIPRSPLEVVYLGMNNTFKPFDNEQVRQAIAMALDKQRLVKNFFPAGTTVADQFLTPDIKPGYTDNLKPTPFDVNGAKQLLTTAGFPNGFSATLSYRTVVRPYLPNPDKVAQDIQAQLKAIGVNLTLNPMESGAFLDQTESGKTQMFLLGWIDDYPGATDIFNPHFSAAVKQWGNVYQDIAQQVSAGGSTADPAARQAAYDKVNQLLQQHAFEVPFAHATSACAYLAKVQGDQCSALTDELFQYISNGTNQVVWIQNAEPLSMWCADEEDGETFRACIQVYDSLYNYEQNGTKAIPGLATSYTSSPDATVWTFKLRQGVKFSDGSAFTANDVVASYDAWWDVKSPNHKGRTGNWTYFGSFFGAQLNAK